MYWMKELQDAVAVETVTTKRPVYFPFMSTSGFCVWGRQCGSENCGALQLRGQEFCYWVKDFLPTFALPVRPKINREGMVELPCQTHILLLVSTPNHSVCNQRHKYIRLHRNGSKQADRCIYTTLCKKIWKAFCLKQHIGMYIDIVP